MKLLCARSRSKVLPYEDSGSPRATEGSNMARQVLPDLQNGICEPCFIVRLTLSLCYYRFIGATQLRLVSAEDEPPFEFVHRPRGVNHVEATDHAFLNERDYSQGRGQEEIASIAVVSLLISVMIFVYCSVDAGGPKPFQSHWTRCITAVKRATGSLAAFC